MLALCLSSLWWTAEAGDTCAAEIHNTNYNGADHRQATGSTYADCCEMCSRSAGCTFWVFDTGQKLCHMKAHKGAPIIGPLNFVSGSVSAAYRSSGGVGVLADDTWGVQFMFYLGGAVCLYLGVGALYCYLFR